MNMNHPGIRPRNNKPAAKMGAPQTLRVLSDDAAARAAPASIAMPRSRTELLELLAGDDALCVRRRAAAASAQPNGEVGLGGSGTNAESQAESPAAPAVDGDLACVIDAWPGLPRYIRAAVLAMIRAT